MTRPLLVALREVRAYLRDKGDLGFSLLLPVAIFALMYGAFGGQSLFHGTAHVVNEDQEGTYSGLLLNRLGEIENLDVELLSSREANSKLERSDLLMVLYIPEDFSTRLASGEQAQLVFKQRGNGGQEGQITASIIRGVAEEVSQELQVRGLVNDVLARSDIPEAVILTTVQGFLDRERENPIVGVAEETVGSSPDPVNQFLPGIVTMFVLFAITLTARTIVRERKNGTLERLLTGSVKKSSILGGIFTGTAAKGLIQILIFWAFGILAFSIDLGPSPLAVIILSILMVLMSSAFGIMLATFVRTERSAGSVAVLAALVMAPLGGSWWPIFVLPQWMQALAKVTPHGWANTGFNKLMLFGADFGAVVPEMLALVGFAAVFGIIAVWRFRTSAA